MNTTQSKSDFEIGDDVVMKKQGGFGSIMFQTGTRCKVMSTDDVKQVQLKRKSDGVTLWIDRSKIVQDPID